MSDHEINRLSIRQTIKPTRLYLLRNQTGIREGFDDKETIKFNQNILPIEIHHLLNDNHCGIHLYY